MIMKLFAYIENGEVAGTATSAADLSEVDVSWVPVPPNIDLDNLNRWRYTNADGFTKIEIPGTREEVNAERDRRVRAGFTFQGILFDFDEKSEANITGAGASAMWAVQNGAQPGDYRWSDPEGDFVWIAADNTTVRMDAQMCVAFSQAARLHAQRLILAAGALKAQDPIPADYKDDSHWPDG